MSDKTPLSDVRFLTIAEAATIMRVAKMTVYRLVHSGELEAVRVGRSFRIPEEALNEFLRAPTGRRVAPAERKVPPAERSVAPAERTATVRIYLGNGAHPKPVEDAVFNLLDVYGFTVDRLGDPVLGSWFREFWSKAKETSPPVEQQLAKIERAIELRGLDQPQSQVDLNQAEAVTRLLSALDPEHNALLQVGSIFLIKVHDTIVVRNLSQVELAYFQRNPALFQKPEIALKVLQEGLATDNLPPAAGDA